MTASRAPASAPARRLHAAGEQDLRPSTMSPVVATEPPLRGVPFLREAVVLSSSGEVLDSRGGGVETLADIAQLALAIDALVSPDGALGRCRALTLEGGDGAVWAVPQDGCACAFTVDSPVNATRAVAAVEGALAQVRAR